MRTGKKVLSSNLCEAAKRFVVATEQWMDNRPDDEQFTWKEMELFAKNEAREFETAKDVINLAILNYQQGEYMKLESVLMASSNSQVRKLGRALDKNPKSPLARMAKKRLMEQVDMILEHDENNVFEGRRPEQFTAVDWSKIFSMLGPFIKILLLLLGV